MIETSGSSSTRYRCSTANRSLQSIRLTHLESWFVVTIRSVDEVSFEENARSVLGGRIRVCDFSVTQVHWHGSYQYHNPGYYDGCYCIAFRAYLNKRKKQCLSQDCLSLEMEALLFETSAIFSSQRHEAFFEMRIFSNTAVTTSNLRSKFFIRWRSPFNILCTMHHIAMCR